MIKKLYHFIVLFLIISTATCAYAVEPLMGTDRTVDARSLALSGALRTAPSGGASVYINPATMSMAHIYRVNMNYQFTGKDNLHDWGLVFLDSITSSRIGAGASLDYRRDSKDNKDFESWDARLALSTAIGSNFFIGFTGRYIRAANDTKSSSVGPNGPNIMDKSDDIQANGFTFDSGIAIKLGDMLKLGLTGYNLTNTDSVYAPIILGTAISVNLMQMLFIETDIDIDFTSYKNVATTWTLGSEIIVHERYSFRAGYSHDFLNKIDRISAGLGFTGTRFAIDLGYKQDIQFYKRFRLAFGIRIFVA